MPKTVYMNINEGTEEVVKLQTAIMYFIDEWVRKHKTVVPKKKILEHMANESRAKLDRALVVLQRRQYIRKAVPARTTSYVQIRSIERR